VALTSQDAEAFWERVDRSAGAEACWEWVGPRNLRTGHGYLTVASRQQVAHRMAFELSCRPIPHGMLVMHTCGNPACCNPGHLVMGTRADQMARRSLERRNRDLSTIV
jgi:hypothetical protein